jgi:hypothetical protein
MAKYFGKVGYAIPTVVKPGVTEEKITEKDFCGEDTRAISRWNTSTQLNDNIDIDKQISIIADPFAYNNFMFIRYITVYGQRWKVNSVEVKYPRLILSVGGIYNGREENRRNETY